MVGSAAEAPVVNATAVMAEAWRKSRRVGRWSMVEGSSGGVSLIGRVPDFNANARRGAKVAKEDEPRMTRYARKSVPAEPQ